MVPNNLNNLNASNSRSKQPVSESSTPQWFNTPVLQPQNSPDSKKSLSSLSAAEVESLLNDFYTDPIGFIEMVVDASAEKHLVDLRDEVELRAALNTFWKKHADAKQFEPYVMQALAHVIQTDEDGVLGEWDELMEKALLLFQSQFGELVKNHPELKPLKPNASLAAMEKGQPRNMPTAKPRFTRQQIAKMTPEEFAKNESAIEEAMRMGRIK